MESLICVCGAGTMGRGIAMSAASQGISVILYDLDHDMLLTAATSIENELIQAAAKKRITPEKKVSILRNIRFSGTLSKCCAPLIIEAIAEKIEAKSALFNELATINSGNTIFLSNTSSLSVTAIGELTSFPARVAGMHFFNPANKMKLVEIVITKYIDEPVTQRLQAFALQLKKTAVICSDTPGFIVNRVARPFYLEAMRLTEQYKIDKGCIDNIMESAGFPMGPFHLMDLIGLDINYAVSCSVYESLGRPARMKPSEIQAALVKQAHLGKKTGRGFFQYLKKSAG
jgi:3-hydroxybutyryl-CoA dehydrogenase